MTHRTHEKDGGLLQWLYEQGEERLSQVADELSRNKGLADAVGNAFKQAVRTKGKIDRNVQTVLALLNLPSKADYQKLETKIETLRGSLLNVSMKLDRVLAAMEKPKKKKAAA